MDLNELLADVVNTYGKNTGYAIPTIGWSKENFVSAFGMYQFWDNHIKISNLLRDSAVSEQAVKSVIFHEYTHQLYAEHSKAFQARMRAFKGYTQCNRELDACFADIAEYPKGERQSLPLDFGQEIVFYILPTDPHNTEAYLDRFSYYNHHLLGVFAQDVPSDYCKSPIRQVVWLVEAERVLYVVGWSRNVQFYPTLQSCDFNEIGLNNTVEYQCQFKQNESKFVFPCNAFKVLYEGEYPNTLLRGGICRGTDIAPEIVKEIVKMINEYDADVVDLGIQDVTLDCIPAIETNDVSTLLLKAKEADAYDRRFLILNKAVCLEKSNRTYSARGLAFFDCWVFDRALQDLEIALTYPNTTKERFDKRAVTRLVEQLRVLIAAI